MDEKLKLKQWKLAWTLALALSLVVPLILGWGSCRDSAKVGLFLALVVYWLAGIFVCQRWKRAGRSLVAGGFLVALLQYFPIVQIAASFTAACAWNELISSEDPLKSMFGGFFMTWVTGGLLICLALTAGSFIVRIVDGPAKAEPEVPTKAKPELSAFDQAWPVEP